MNNIEEIKDFVSNIDCGYAVFAINRNHSTLELKLPEFHARMALNDSKNPLEVFISNSIDREFDKETRKLKVVFDSLMPKLCDWIQSRLIEMAMETSPSNQPKRTGAYKEMDMCCRINKREEVFINDALPIINYYYKAKTESKENNMNMVVHNNNVQALFAALRKKHGSGTTRKTT